MSYLIIVLFTWGSKKQEVLNARTQHFCLPYLSFKLPANHKLILSRKQYVFNIMVQVLYFSDKKSHICDVFVHQL
jgi:hypothetical protein